MSKKDELHILWTNGDAVTFKKMISMYAYNSLEHEWWEEVTLIIWGSPAELAAEDRAVQKEIEILLEKGVHVTACKSCADQLGATEKLRDLGVEVKYWGQPLTDVIKSDKNIITI